MAKWIIDAAYGGNEEGIVGKKGRMEKNITLDAALEAKRILELNAESVFLIRNNDVFINEEKRNEFVFNWNGDYYIRFNMNESNNLDESGTLVEINNINGSRKLGEYILQEMVESFNSNNLGIKEVLEENTLGVPMIICRGEFLSNIHIEVNFNAKSYGRAVARGCIKFLNKKCEDELKLTVQSNDNNIKSGWRVCAGVYKEFDDAKKALTDIRARGVANLYIVPFTKKK